MIGYLAGKIIRSNPNDIIIDVAGTGYKVFTTKKIDGEKELFIHEVIREDCHDLYGFEKYEELILFERLISVNGVGPKAGMAIMSSARVDQIESAIIGSNVNFFTAISGIGKKAAAKIILELKSKLSNLDDSEVVKNIDKEDEVLQALISLGYKKTEALTIIGKLPVGLKSDEEKIRWCLKNIK